jgi:uncharacterized membrane protein
MTTGTELSPGPADAARGPAARRAAVTRIGWTWILLSCLAIAVYAVVPYFTASLAELADSGASGLAGTYAPLPAFVQAAFYAHIVAGGVAIIAGPLQFWRGLRDRHRAVHRAIGRTYLTAVAIAGFAALVMVPFNDAGLVGFFGFGTMAVLWLASGWRAYRAIRRGDVSNHRAWMMRNFALTYSAVTLRLWIGVLIGVQLIPGGDVDFGDVFENAYAAVPFLAWLPNLVVAEWLIRRRGLPSYRLSSATGRMTGTEAASGVRG